MIKISWYLETEGSCEDNRILAFSLWFHCMTLCCSVIIMYICKLHFAQSDVFINKKFNLSWKNSFPCQNALTILFLYLTCVECTGFILTCFVSRYTYLFSRVSFSTHWYKVLLIQHTMMVTALMYSIIPGVSYFLKAVCPTIQEGCSTMILPLSGAIRQRLITSYLVMP